jgi:hypothetical protein
MMTLPEEIADERGLRANGSRLSAVSVGRCHSSNGYRRSARGLGDLSQNEKPSGVIVVAATRQ